MTITQTVEIPANRRLTIDIPPEVPAGKAQVELKVIPFAKDIENQKEAIPLLTLRDHAKVWIPRMRFSFASEQTRHLKAGRLRITRIKSRSDNYGLRSGCLRSYYSF